MRGLDFQHVFRGCGIGFFYERTFSLFSAFLRCTKTMGRTLNSPAMPCSCLLNEPCGWSGPWQPEMSLWSLESLLKTFGYQSLLSPVRVKYRPHWLENAIGPNHEATSRICNSREMSWASLHTVCSSSVHSFIQQTSSITLPCSRHSLGLCRCSKEEV